MLINETFYDGKEIFILKGAILFSLEAATWESYIKIQQ